MVAQSRRLAALGAATVLLALAGCGSVRDDAVETAALDREPGAADTVVFGVDRLHLAGDVPADRRFLERLLDHYQGLDYLVARMDRDPASGRARSHAERFENHEHPEKRRMDELLRSHYGERYIPIVPPRFKAAVDSLAALPPDEQPRALVRLLAKHHRADLTLIDSMMPALQDTVVRTVAEDLRAHQAHELDRLLARLAPR
ncbi:MAG TPA: hypothetical protein VFW66_09580 [Gemmatimonadales bacterium]|nr:hypothetical protein [Gemmatimonadales bacterium]